MNIFRDPCLFLAFGFGAGLSPKAPGTLGTLVAVPFYLLLTRMDRWSYVSVVVLTALLGIWICAQAAKKLGVHDHQGIVWDEMVGYWITMIAVPVSALTVLLGFILFRFFDIVKPWPIGEIDRKVTGGLGIMLDDIVAGLFSLVVIHLSLWIEII